ncbi:TetR/AcrR family transcriptional regulator [Umezawaea sp. Da 62-37]|uniref:TetR/AcrR family transcriptional regulator n=1 Tax=Umezawaea sp. Da 62-37 TaxID=3075927 RepID=UPI0028F700A4|nr:TetR/AcrR family transcriptional regulator [Umezawaea sp. Da 62-37]WNV89709.1 TetR/AcrR family transcriptional regulator [Umezawaea sp. Da 62-37]
MAERRRRTRDDWTRAALDALAEGGVAAVAVEPLAARVGASKGSAYWHFPNRDALLLATVERWEREHLQEMAELVRGESDPAERLRLIFGRVLEECGGGCAVESALLAAADDPVVAPVLKRVADGRLRFLEGVFGALGFSPEVSCRRAVLAYAVYLGQAQLRAVAPHVVFECGALLEDTLGALRRRG